MHVDGRLNRADVVYILSSSHEKEGDPAIAEPWVNIEGIMLSKIDSDVESKK